MHLRSFPHALWAGILAAAFATSVHAQAPEKQEAFLGHRTDGLSYQPLSLGEASALEQQLATHPDDETARDKLLKYYWHYGLREQRLESIFWLIEHHPESPLLSQQTAQIAPEMSANMLKVWFPTGMPMNEPADFDRAIALWDQQVKSHPRDARVLANAARRIGFDRANEREIALLERAQQLDPRNPIPWLWPICTRSYCCNSEAISHWSSRDGGERAGRISNRSLTDRVITIPGSSMRFASNSDSGSPRRKPRSMSLLSITSTKSPTEN